MHQPNPNKIFPLCIIMAKICAKNHKVFHFVILACEKSLIYNRFYRKWKNLNSQEFVRKLLF